MCSSPKVNYRFLCKLYHHQSCGPVAPEGDKASKFISSGWIYENISVCSISIGNLLLTFSILK